ncbi:S1 domain-containing RNA-binding protein [Sutcliffiella deserti]|uniref:S1 domain-containing RNA-binding protein n=1 Tax=Sutcliffiella deserti TaxID=2875501 RepID=UPI001CBAEC19|nr:S1 domain-containing RNA-binding protein [Sutcliffiella deserti]
MSIEVGSKLQGKVTGITNFGAFVELPGGTTGLVHISEVADNYVKDINDHLKVNDEVLVKVINVEKDGKIGLSIKKASDTYREPQPRSSAPSSPSRPSTQNRSSQRPPRKREEFRPKENFEQKVARFLKDSEDRLSSLKRNTESKRGGRGAKRG